MVVDLKRLTGFTIQEEKEICFDVDGKKVVFKIPFYLSVNPNEKRLYVGNDCPFVGYEDGTINLTDTDVETILSGDESIITTACRNFAFSLITKNKYCKK